MDKLSKKAWRKPNKEYQDLDEYYLYDILLSYLYDGIIWSNTIEIYIQCYNLSKASVPYVVPINNNQLIISFQTDEDSLPNEFKGDMNSILKIMIDFQNK